ncbi:hypothetical protein CEV31_4149 [Brucella thiophenivorans]|uniref:Uncharacterized protein n=1 Tax=Brucella thiophenivorans TaxID=571255 RepID=A0A256EYH7_9HYPH|nr:hypothetical protein CEV31_4149 [Brucella thiophenivorans]
MFQFGNGYDSKHFKKMFTNDFFIDTSEHFEKMSVFLCSTV